VGMWSQEMEEGVVASAEEKASQVVQDAEAFPDPEVHAIFQHTLSAMTPTIQAQMEDYVAFLNQKGA